MRILLVNHEFTVSGASLSLFRLAEHLRRAGHELVIFSANPAPGPIGERYRAAGFTPVLTADSSKFDLALCNTVCVAEVVRLIAAYTKTVWLIRETDLGVKLMLDYASVRSALALATAVVFQTEFHRDRVYRSFLYKLDPAKFHIIPQGIDVGVPGMMDKPSGRLRIVCIGGVYPAKRQADLIEAVVSLDNPAFECVMIGPVTGLADAARAQIAAMPDRFRLLGQLEHADTLAWLNSADIFCLPSESESQPVSALEAAALHKPLVLSDLPVHDGIWRHGENCLLFPVGDTVALAEHLASLAQDPALRRGLGDAAAETAGGFRPAALFARFDALIAAVAGPGRAA